MFRLKSVLTFRSDYIKNVLVLMTGSTVTQAIPIAVSPILTRIYDPDDFGIFALFTAVTAVFSLIISARYELAILIPSDEEEAADVTVLSVIVAGVLSLIVGFFFFLFNEQLSLLLGDRRVGVWLYFAPVVIFLAGVSNAFKYYNIRKNNFKTIAQSGIVQAVCSASIQLGLGLVKPGPAGLIFGNGLPFFASSWLLFRKGLKDLRNSMTSLTYNSGRTLAFKYSEFPKYSLGAGLANILSQHLSTVFISSYYSLFLLGQYSLVNRILNMPSILLGTAIGDVFTKRALDEKALTGNCTRSFRSAYLALGAASVVIFSILYFTIRPVFIFVFGDKWAVAGQFAQIIMPLVAVRFWMAPLTMVFVIFSSKQRTALFWQLSFLVVTLIIFVFAKYWNLPIEKFLSLFTYANCLLYCFQFLVLRSIAKGTIRSNGVL